MVWLSSKMRWPHCATFIAATCCIVSYLLFYPPTHGVKDEVGFINEGYVLAHGATSAEGAGFDSLPDFIEVGGVHLGWRNPGRSLLIVPFLLVGGYRAIFVSGLVLHLALIFVGGGIMEEQCVNPLWIFLIAAHPTLVLYSRTVMGDTGAALFLLLAFQRLTQRNPSGVQVGLFVGLAVLMRYHSAIVIPTAAPLLAKEQRRQFLFSSVAVGMLAVLWDECLFGSLLPPAHPGFFSLSFVWAHSLQYAASLMLLWPLSLVALAFRSPVRRAVLAFVLPFLCLFIPYYWMDSGNNWVESLVLQQRLIQPIIPILVVQYAIVLNNMVKRLGGRQSGLVMRMTAVVGCLLVFTVNRVHQRHLQELVGERRLLRATVPDGAVLLCNWNVAKLVAVPEEGTLPFRLVTLYQGALVSRATLPGHFYFAVVASGVDKNAVESTRMSLPDYSFRQVLREGSFFIFDVSRTGLNDAYQRTPSNAP